MGWDDAPSHICRGGDIRGLAFCCPPVKPCPIMNALKEVNLTPEEYMRIKQDFGQRTRLGEGAGTCFGSLVYCCKSSKPCPLRDMTLQRIGMSHDEYLTLKKQLSEELIGSKSSNSDGNVDALVNAFDISKDEASKILSDCDNDLRMAVKLLRVRSLEGSE